MEEKKEINEGLKELGKSLMTLSNLFLIVFFFNTYIQKDNFSLIGAILSIYTFICLYYYGYYFINKGGRKC